MIRSILVAVSLILTAAPAYAADPAIGIWVTQPDRKDLTSHIEIRQCGDRLCGKILEAFNPAGQKVMTKNIGKELFWDMLPAGAGSYKDGTVWVPLLNVKARATMTLAGNTLTVRGCKALVCDGQTWTRMN